MDPLGRGHGPESGNGDLAADDDDRHPGRDCPGSDETDESRDDQQLIGSRVEELAQNGDLFFSPGPKTVQHICECSQDEDSEGDDVMAPEISQEHNYENGDGEDAKIGQGERAIHLD